jgi:hypothetical protein
MKAQKIEEQHSTNGVNVDELFGTIDAVKKSPVIAKFKFRADNQWFDGGYKSQNSNFGPIINGLTAGITKPPSKIFTVSRKNTVMRQPLPWVLTNRPCCWEPVKDPIRWSTCSRPWLPA